MSVSVRDQLHAVARRVEELGDIDKAITSRARRRNRAVTLTAAAGLAAAVVLAAVIVSNPFGGVQQPEPLQPPTPPATPTATPTATPAPFPGSADFGWPTTSRNPAGNYSLDDRYCGSNGSDSCIVGFMHNGYGSGDVEIYVKVGADEVVPDNGGTPTTIAGHEGTYRQFNARQEDWTFDVDGTPVGVTLRSAPGTSQADLAEAHSVIDSMYTEPSEAGLGFRLVFTLPSNDWDSG